MAAHSPNLHYRDLDGVRGLLAVSVMLYHFGIGKVAGMVTGGFVQDPRINLAVDFFFVLSGLVLARSYARRRRSFVRRLFERVTRLMPVHIVLMLLLIPLAVAGQATNPLFTDMRDGGASGLLSEAIGLYIYLYADYPNWNPPSWSINVELWIPVLLAAVLPFVVRRSPQALIVAFVAVLTAQGWLAWQLALDNDLLVARGIVGLSLGALLFALLERGIVSMPASRWYLPAGTALFMALMAFSDPWPVAAPAAMIVASLMVALGTGSHGLLSHAGFQWLGQLSYTIYMVHMPVKFWTYYLLDTSSIAGNMGVTAIMILVTLAGAAVMTRFVEVPSMRLGKQVVFRQPRAPTLA